MRLPGRRKNNDKKADKQAPRRDDWRTRDRGRGDSDALDDDQFSSYRNLRRDRPAERGRPDTGKDEESGGRGFLGLSLGGGKDKESDRPAQATGRFGQPRRKSADRGSRNAKRRDDAKGKQNKGRGFLGLGGGKDKDKDARSRDKGKDAGEGPGWLRQRFGTDDDNADDRAPGRKPFLGNSVDERSLARARGQDSTGSQFRRPTGAEDDRSRTPDRRPSRPGDRASYLGTPDRDRSSGSSFGSGRQTFTRDRDQDQDRDRSSGSSFGSGRQTFTRDRDQDQDRDRSSGSSFGSGRQTFTRDRDTDRGSLPSRSESQRDRFGARSGTRPVPGRGDKDDKDQKDSGKGRFSFGLRKSKGKKDDKRPSRDTGRPGSRSSASARGAAPGTTQRPSRGRNAAAGTSETARTSRRSPSRGQPGSRSDKATSRSSKTRKSTRSTRSSRSASAASRRPLPSGKKEKTALSMHQGLDFDRKIDLVGVMLVAFALVLFFSVIPSVTFGVLPEPESGLTYALNNILSQLFGWGKLVLPVAAFWVGIWLMRESFSEEGIELDYFRVLGMILLFTCALAWLHMVQLFDNVQPSVEAFRPYSRELALEDGEGGGWIGHQIYILLLSQLLDFGTISVLVAWLVIGLMLTFDLTVVEIWTFIAGLTGIFSFVHFTREDRAQRRAARRMLKAKSAPVQRPGDQPQQLELQQAATDTGRTAAAGTPKPIPGRPGTMAAQASATDAEDASTPAGESAARPAPRINRRGIGSGEDDAESIDTTGGEQTRDAAHTPPRRRLPHLRSASDSADTDANRTAKEAGASTAGETSQNADQTAEQGESGKGKLFGFLRRGKSEAAEDDAPTNHADEKPASGADADRRASRRGRFARFARRASDDPGAAGKAGDEDKPDIPVPPRPNAADRNRDAKPDTTQASDKTGDDTATDQADQSETRQGGIFARLRGRNTGQERDHDDGEPAESGATGQNADRPSRQPERTAAKRDAEAPESAAASPARAERTDSNAEKPAPTFANPRATRVDESDRSDNVSRFKRPDRPAQDARSEASPRTAESSPRAEQRERGQGLGLAGTVVAGAAGAAGAALLGRRRDADNVEDDRAEEAASEPRDAERGDLDARVEALRQMRERQKTASVSERQGAGADIIPPHRRPVRDISEPVNADDDPANDSTGDPADGKADEKVVPFERPARPARPDLIARRRESERRLEQARKASTGSEDDDDQVDTDQGQDAADNVAGDAAQSGRKAPPEAANPPGKADAPDKEPAKEPEKPADPPTRAAAAAKAADKTDADDPAPDRTARAEDADATPPAKDAQSANPAGSNQPDAKAERQSRAAPGEDATQPAEQPTQKASERPAPRIRRHNIEGRGPSAIPVARQQERDDAGTGNGKHTPERRTHAPAKDDQTWTVPDFRKLLKKGDEQRINDEILLDKARVIEDTLASFGAPGKVVEVNPGPVITQFGVEPDYLIGRGGKKTRIKVNQIAKLDADIALALAAKTIRIEAPVPGKGFVGIEVPNDEVSLVSLYDIMDSPEFRRIDSNLRLALGLAVDGTPVAADLTAMPHLLIAGTTGSGKSVCVNSIIASLLLQNTPEDLQFIMVDPKRVELTSYNGIPHLVAPVVVELERIVGVLQWVQREMEERYRKFASIAARNILDYNRKVGDSGDKMPYYVVVVDELADLMMLAPDETERLLARLAQMARATGIHLIISTQRPSVDIITGLIKANFPARIAFAVASSVDSRVILDQPGAEKLLGRGDLLYQSPDAAAPLRMQGVFVSDQEISTITRYWKGLALDQADAGDRETLASPHQNISFGRAAGQAARADSEPRRRSSEPTQTPLWTEDSDEDSERDELYEEAVELVQRLNKASISLLQRRLRIGYTRAARLIDIMEQESIVGPQKEGSKPREVIKQKIESGDD